jgi:surface protein
MFYQCSSLGEIDVSNWDVSKVTNFDHFAAHANLKRKGIENWKTTSATNMNALFHNCAEEELDLSGWDVSKVQFFCQMFENSPNLKRIKGLEKWNTSAGLGFDGMFERCSKLEEVDLSSFNTTKAKNNVDASDNGHKTATLQNMFLSCNNLKKVTVGVNFAVNGDGTNTAAGNKLVLPTPSTDYIAGADGNWYAFNGDPYAPNAIPDKTADTYFASFPLCQNEDVIVKNGSLIDVAKAIKEKNGATAKYTPAQFGAAIRAL